jgi:hypothetical protein
MRVIPPLTITEARLTSSTAPEPGVGEAAWASGTTYAIGDKVILGSPSSTVTITIASPVVVSWASNGLPDGTPIVLTTTGALPTGLTAGRIYYVVNRAAGTFQLSATLDGAAIVTTGSQSGTHTATAQIHRRYESQAASNIGNPPAIDAGTKWLDIGPTNRWACFDLLRNTATTFPASPGIIVITPGQRVDSIGLVGLVADSVTVKVTVAAVDVYTRTENLSTREVLDWYDYFFAPFTYKSAFALFDLPPYSTGVITVTLTRSVGLPELGGLVLGSNVYLGRTLHDAENDALNFSKVNRDDFGNSELVPRRTVPKVKATTRIAKAGVNKAIAARVALNAQPALWSGLDDTESGYFEPLLILGYYRQMTVTMDQPEEGLLNLELEEI